MKHYVFFLVLLSAVTMTSAHAAFLESDIQKDPKPAPRPPHPIPLPQPVENEVVRLISNCSVGSPYHHKGLTVFPLTLRRNEDNRPYYTLDEVVQRAQITIMDSGRVPEVLMTNRSNRRVFLMAGETLAGGKQNRMIREDVVLPPGREIRVPVYCIEKGRWNGAPTALSTTGTLSHPALRQQAARKASQESLWNGIAESAARLDSKSKSEDYQKIYSNPKVRRQLSEYRDAFSPIWRSLPAGIVVCRFGRIVGAEVFGSSDLNSRLQHKIIDSYVIGRIQHPIELRHELPTVRDIERYLGRIHRSRFSYGSTPGEGRSISITGVVSGSALSLSGVAVHVSLFE